ncbi:hypothetical protein TMEN_9023 [Trichophyton mentagrophytes]|nr:hypothetical protein TMEN_9023 [Trichophyton mentagrophytes]
MGLSYGTVGRRIDDDPRTVERVETYQGIDRTMLEEGAWSGLKWWFRIYLSR